MMESEIWTFDLNKSTWDRLPARGDSPVPPSRTNHTLVYDWASPSPRLIIFGGRGEGNMYLKDVWLFSLQDSVWVKVNQGTDSWPRERESFGVSYDRGRIAIFGGNVGGNKTTGLPSVLNNQLWQLILNDDCLSKSTCEECSLISGCGWCEANEHNFQCVAGVSFGPYSSVSCPTWSSTWWSVQLLDCPTILLPPWIIALIIIACLVFVGILMYFTAKVRNHHLYERM
eukprot:TRINITY_DN11291_c0_g1_i2.p1 TRINITY_DN11291_c0_g1~~TRINITY_DN11291_c0_g1_i2.p1  ORF type:complete len:228 (-),score=40.10 TRINITY_DN11291_c0_g1_i2:189-872(-)